jgi:hypothetical protein
LVNQKDVLYLFFCSRYIAVYLGSRLLSALHHATDSVLLNLWNQRALPRIIALSQKGEKIRDVLVSDTPRSILPRCALELGAGATCHWGRRWRWHICWHHRHLGRARLIHVNMRVRRDMRATAAAAVRVHVRVKVRVCVHFRDEDVQV